MHYVGTLAENGTQFDSSRDRGDKFDFVIGKGKKNYFVYYWYQFRLLLALYLSSFTWLTTDDEISILRMLSNLFI